jgi:hypothetical protein
MRPGLNRASVSTDGPGSVYLPRSAADWVALGLPAPSTQYNCQESSGNLAPAIGTATLTAQGAGISYGNTVAGWDCRFTGTTYGAVGTANFHTTDASLDLASGQSGAWLIYAALIEGASSWLFYVGSHTNGFEVSSGSIPRTVHNSVSTSLSSTTLSAVVRPWLWYRNATTNVSGMLTIEESKTSTHSEAALSGLKKGFGGADTASARAPATARHCLAAFWSGADAETIAAKATLVSLGWSVAW